MQFFARFQLVYLVAGATNKIFIQCVIYNVITGKAGGVIISLAAIIAHYSAFIGTCVTDEVVAVTHFYMVVTVLVDVAKTGRFPIV